MKTAIDNIIGRRAEKNELEEAYASHEAEFVVVYGRRRVGKTYLIKSFFQEKRCIFFQNVGIYNGSIKEQLTRFSKEIGNTFYQGAAIKVPLNWMEALEALSHAISQIPKNKKVVLFFDELPWMSTHRSGILRALEYFWNRHWVNDKRLKLIVCGSSASWMIQKIVKGRGGFHNRLTRKLNLLPFNLNETSSYLKYIGYPCQHKQVLYAYMVTGGVPFYLKHFKKNLSIDQNINKLFFSTNSLFFDEFDDIFSSLFNDSDQYKELVNLIAHHQYGISRTIINQKNKLTGKGGRLTKRLEDLEHAGFISSFISYGHKKRGTFYRINDEYCYFYLKWIDPIKSHIKQDRATNYWQKFINTPEYFGWLGYAFENICYKHLPQIKNALGVEYYSVASPWRYAPGKKSSGQGVQIDLLLDRDDNAMTLCEIKYTNEPFLIDKSYANQLKQKMEIFQKVTQTKKQIFLAMICASGLKKNLYSEELVHNALTLEALFKEGKERRA